MEELQMRRELSELQLHLCVYYTKLTELLIEQSN